VTEMNGKYILDEEGNPVLILDILQWARWFETAERHVADTRLDNVRISTVFLGLDHSWGQGPPLLWETMIFGGIHDGYQARYSTKAEAEVSHARAVSIAKGKGINVKGE